MKDTLQTIQNKNKNEPEFLQTISETFFSLKPVFEKEPKLVEIFKVLAEPERCIIFRVPWINKNGIQCFNRGFRIQHSSALGPYKGGLRFHPTVTQSIMKFLAFEQTFKNSLTGLQLGGAKGGSDFDPKKKTSSEIMNFCQSFMTELSKHMGSQWDIPAGDINVGPKEIGYLFGQYKRLQNKFDGSLTGKGIEYGGSYIRPESTGYGAVFFAQHWCDDHNVQIKGARCALSGSGNVALYAAQKLLALGAIPITLSDSDGFVYEPNGFNEITLSKVMHLKFNLKKRLEDYAKVR
jgi:glutamate dehydrogenase (NADP+)